MAVKALSMHQITKDFPGVRALEGVDFTVSAGEIHGVVGANGAGKSTLVRILSGLLPDYKGSVKIEGQSVRLSSTRIAIDCGIAVLQQEPDLAWNLSVCENILLGKRREITRRFGLLDRKAMYRECARLLDECQADLSPTWIVGTLGRGQLQLVQIVKVLVSRPKILVLDEPTTALTGEEREKLFALLRAYATQGTAVVFISHDIEDVFRVSQRISVLRDGRKVTEVATNDSTPSLVLREMFGTHLSWDARPRNEHGPEALVLDGVRTTHVLHISLAVHEGEVLGLAGRPESVVEVLRAVFGAIPRRGGRVHVRGREASISNPRDAIRAGIGLLPEDRARDGLFVRLSVLTNITMMVLRRFAKCGILRWHRPRELASRKVSELGIRTPGLHTQVGALSGGNQQKTLFARWLCAGPSVFLLEEPTAGMDVGAKQEILRITRDLRGRGAALLMASSDVDELLRLCDRIVVLGKNGTTQLIEVDEKARSLLVGALAGQQEAP